MRLRPTFWTAVEERNKISSSRILRGLARDLRAVWPEVRGKVGIRANGEIARTWEEGGGRRGGKPSLAAWGRRPLSSERTTQGPPSMRATHRVNSTKRGGWSKFQLQTRKEAPSSRRFQDAKIPLCVFGCRKPSFD